MGRVGNHTASSTRHGRGKTSDDEAERALLDTTTILRKLSAQRVPRAHPTRGASSKMYCLPEKETVEGCVDCNEFIVTFNFTVLETTTRAMVDGRRLLSF